MTCYLYGEEMLTSNVINEIATVKYVHSYMTKVKREWVRH